MNKEELNKKIADIEAEMNSANFWNDKDKAQRVIAEYQELKDALVGVGKYDKGNAVLTILAGAGGMDAEDFARMLLEMYGNYVKDQGWEGVLLHENQNDQGGFRNVSIEVKGKNVFGNLQYESGVHRLVRISPFKCCKKETHCLCHG